MKWVFINMWCGEGSEAFFMNDKNIFIGVCEDNSLHINLVKGYID